VGEIAPFSKPAVARSSSSMPAFPIALLDQRFAERLMRLRIVRLSATRDSSSSISGAAGVSSMFETPASPPGPPCADLVDPQVDEAGLAPPGGDGRLVFRLK